jgi:cell division GTPase FtsZ
MQALDVRTPEALAALVVVSADTYRLPLEETATMAVDQLQSNSSPEDADKLWGALVKALGDKLNEESAGTGEAKEEEEEEEKKEKAEKEKEEEKEEEILGKVLEWRDPVVRRGPLQRPVQI